METILLTLRVTTRKELKDIADSEQRSVNGLINYALKKYIDEENIK